MIGNYLMLAQSCVFRRVLLDDVTSVDTLANPRPNRTSIPQDVSLANKEKFGEVLNFAKNLQVLNQEEFGGGASVATLIGSERCLFVNWWRYLLTF